MADGARTEPQQRGRSAGSVPYPAPVTAPPSARLVVATYNIHRAVGGDRRQDPLRIADTIAALGADVAALQEVETPARPEPRALLLRLGELGYEVVLGNTMRRGPHHYGNLLITRLPVLRRRLIDLSQPRREPRGLIDAQLALTGADGSASTLRCLATHLGLRTWERRRQIACIEALIEQRSAQQQTRTLLLGDFNEWLLGHRRLAAIDRLLTPAPRRASFPAAWPVLALDRIWHGSGFALEQLEVVRTPSTRAASDHLPLRARLQAL